MPQLRNLSFYFLELLSKMTIKNVAAKKALVLFAFAAFVFSAAGVLAKWYPTEQSGKKCTYGYDAGHGYGYDCKTRSSNSGGGSGGGSTSTPSETPTTGTAVNTGVVSPEVEKVVTAFTGTEEGKVALESLKTSSYETEWNNAYLFARAYGITTMPTVQSADMMRKLTRAELAKMMSVFTLKFTERKAVENKVGCDVFADKNQVNAELQGYMKTACELEIMGLHSDGKTPLTNFMPNKFVSRAELVTVLSRVMFGNQFDNNAQDAWWAKHMEKLHADGVVKNTVPTIEELRGYVFLMLYRAKGK